MGEPDTKSTPESNSSSSSADSASKSAGAPVSRARKILKGLGFFFGVQIVLVAGFAGYNMTAALPTYPKPSLELKVNSTPEKLERGLQLASMLCLECHLDPETKKASGRRLADVPPELATAYSYNLTHDPQTGALSKYSDGDLVVLLRTGISRDGRFLPPWMPRLAKMSDEDIASIIAYLRSDDPVFAPVNKQTPASTFGFVGRLLMRIAWKPVPMPSAEIVTPTKQDKVAYGKYVVQGVGACYACHSRDLSEVSDVNPESSGGYLGGGSKLIDASGHAMVTTNITPDRETGIGAWSLDDFKRPMREGKRPDGSLIRYPMGLFSALSDEEVEAAFEYLKTVPPIKHAVRNSFSSGSSNSPGDAAYEKYGCLACHGPTGVAIGDLRGANRDFPDDAQLEAYIRNPQKAKPGVRMPSYDTMIPASDMAPLIRHVRSLSSKLPGSGSASRLW